MRLIGVRRRIAQAGAPCYAWLAAVVVALLFAGSVAADGQFEDADEMAIENVLERRRDALMSRPEAVGVGIGERAGKPVIVLMVKHKTPETLAGLPAEIDGHPLIVEEVGEITAY